MQIKSSENKVTRIMIVDDHPMMRSGIAAQIANEPDMEVCGEADDVEPALRMVSETSPDLIIVDLSLKSGHGIDLVKRLHERNSNAKMLVNSMYDETVYAERALQAGAMGYQNKQSAGESLIAAIRTVLAG
ncbi:MAG TPA: hypothetical protein DCF63_05160 [Planctomycetaceae bacterium]|nr:hypothetical protein [Planctomycetaceae bacterium]